MRDVAKRAVRRYRPARTHLIGVGTAKSGTHSLASIFQPRYRAAHEPDADRMIRTLIAAKANRDGARSDLRAYLTDRQRRLRLEVDSSQLNGHAVDALVDLFPQARFVLTVREPHAYLDSITRHSANRTVKDTWRAWRDVRFAGCPPRPADTPLTSRGLYPVDGYLIDWVAHNNRVLDTVPPERLLVVETGHLHGTLPRLAAFAGVPLRTLNADQAHTFTGVGERVELDPGYVDDRVDALCAATWEKVLKRATTPAAI